MDLSKIAGAELMQFACEGAESESRSVIVEALGQRTAVRPSAKGNPMPAKDMGSRMNQQTMVERDADAAMSALENAIQSLMDARSTVRLQHAKAFVVSVTPSALRTISENPAVAVVRPNREHHLAH